METWIPLVVAVLGLVSAILTGKVAWNRGHAIQATARAIEAFKGAMVDIEEPDVAKLLTRGIGTALEQAGPAATKAHESQVTKAGANLKDILGPLIAKLARPEPPNEPRPFPPQG